MKEKRGRERRRKGEFGGRVDDICRKMGGMAVGAERRRRLKTSGIFLAKERTVGVPFDSTYWLCETETCHQCLFSHNTRDQIHRHLSWK